MKNIHPYQHMKPRKVFIHSGHKMSFTISRFGEDDEIRFGFGVCGKVERSHIKVVEIDYSWLGVVFNIVSTSECDNGAVKRTQIVKNDLSAVKAVAREVILEHLHNNPLGLEGVLNIIHSGSREQGQLETIKNAIDAMNTEIKFP
jgi:hypothetical protein|tara:strand:+ start:1235 stop:1669 length:435 start_codon:yes stop_codon:yes gene_type:complete